MMDITNVSKQRFKVGVQLFCEDKEPVSYYGVAFYIDRYNKPTLYIKSWSDWSTEYAIKEMAKEKIKYSKETLKILIKESNEFRQCIKNLPRIFEFLYDYGNGAVLIAQERNGVFKWCI